jgi:hypothetical protein
VVGSFTLTRAGGEPTKENGEDDGACGAHAVIHTATYRNSGSCMQCV